MTVYVVGRLPVHARVQLDTSNPALSRVWQQCGSCVGCAQCMPSCQPLETAQRLGINITLDY